MTAQTAHYVSLNRRNKRGAIAGAGLLWFYNLIFSFTMPVALPMILFSNSFGVAIFNAVYNIFYNARYAQAVALGGESIWLLLWRMLFLQWRHSVQCVVRSCLSWRWY